MATPCRRFPPLLSFGPLLGDHQIWVSGSNPRAFVLCQPLEPTLFLLVRPNDPVLSRRGAPCLDPTLLDPVVDLLRNHAQMTSQVGNPPFVLCQEIVTEQLSHQTQTAQQCPNSRLGKHTTATRGS